MNSAVMAREPREPDPDAIKMFVGQIPRSMDENELREMFEEFGNVCQLNVLRDKVTGQSKGCCFVTMATRQQALEAQCKLHNAKIMKGMHHPVQMKPADGEKRSVEERKLFVGMISKKNTENDIRMMFAPFGTIEECTVLRDQAHQSKGCAFVTYSTKQSANNAIKAMHHSQTQEGCSSPMVVKLADTQKDKEAKKSQTVNNNLWPLPTLGGITNLTAAQQYLALLQQAATTGNVGTMTNVGNFGDVNNVSSLQNIQNLAALASFNSSPAAGSHGLGATTPISPTYIQGTMVSNSSPISSMTALNTLSSGTLPSMTAVTPNMAAAAAANSLSLNGTSLGSSPASMDTLTQAYSGIQQYAASFPSAFASQAALQQLQASALTTSPAGKQQEGPDGANLFIYHLPQDFSDHDLMTSFAPFGSIVSAKVFIDKQTNLSKCFGFVSYTNPADAQTAITAMNGFQIGMKRLKVQLKRPKTEKPYAATTKVT